jgi:DNA-binding MarR family transcriptional regulator
LVESIRERPAVTDAGDARAPDGERDHTRAQQPAQQLPQLGQQLFEALRRLRKLPWMSPHYQSTKASGMHVLFCLDYGTREAGREAERGMMISEIGQRLKVTSPTITQLVKELEAIGHVERTVDRKDRRVIRVHLTESGRAVVQQGRTAVRRVFAGLVEHLGDEDTETLVHLLNKVLAYEAPMADKREEDRL